MPPRSLIDTWTGKVLYAYLGAVLAYALSYAPAPVNTWQALVLTAAILSVTLTFLEQIVVNRLTKETPQCHRR